jgi:type IV pilus assembly protein PilC
MPTFTYIGKDRQGKPVKEQVTADDRFAVYDTARENGHTVDEVRDATQLSIGTFLNMDRINYYLSRIKTDELVMMTRNLSSMLIAGLPLSRALSVIERQSSNPRLKGVIIDVAENIQSGSALHESLEKYPKVFSDLYVSMVRAGEEGGTLAEALATLALQMERSSSLKKKIKGAMIYPSIVLVIMLSIGVLMMIYVMPSITATFVDLEVELPATTQVLIATSDFMVANTIFVLCGLVGAIVGFIYALRTYYGKKVFHWIIIRLPVIGQMVKETNSAQTARTLSSLLHSGVDVMRALSITEDVIQNVYYKPVIKEAATRVEKGTPLSETFIEHNKLYPVLVGEMILVGEETGEISQMLEQLATFYESEVEQKTKDLSTIIEPILMVVIGGTVGFFALAMIAPIYSISDSIG